MNNITRSKSTKKEPLDISVINNEIQRISKDNGKYITKKEMMDIMTIINSHDVKIKALGESIKTIHRPPVETLKRSSGRDNSDLQQKFLKLENLIKSKTTSDRSKSKNNTIRKHKSKKEDSDTSMSSGDSNSDSDCEDSIYEL